MGSDAGGGMDGQFWGAVGGAAIAGLGNFFGGQADREANANLNEWNILEQRARDKNNERIQREYFDRNEALQREFAQNGIRWRVEDAAAAGLHPLAALGGSGASYSPSSVSVGSSGFSSSGDVGAGNTARTLGNFGQDIGNAISRTQTPQEKAFKAFQLERMGIDNEIARMELADRRKRLLEAPGASPGDNAGYTISGQPDAMNHRIKVMPSLVTASERGAAQQAAGATPLHKMYRTKRGYIGLLSQDASEATESDWLAALGLHVQGLTSGRGGPQKMTPGFKIGPGKRWAYGGPAMGYGEVDEMDQTLWEAMHAIRDNRHYDDREDMRKYHFGNLQKSYYESGGRRY